MIWRRIAVEERVEIMLCVVVGQSPPIRCTACSPRRPLSYPILHHTRAVYGELYSRFWRVVNDDG